MCKSRSAAPAEEPEETQKEEAKFGYWVAVSFTVNYIMGCGFLGVPDAFLKSGVLLGPVVMVCFAILCNLSKDYLLEVMSRAEAITKVLSYCSVLGSAHLSQTKFAHLLDQVTEPGSRDWSHTGETAPLLETHDTLQYQSDIDASSQAGVPDQVDQVNVPTLEDYKLTMVCAARE